MRLYYTKRMINENNAFYEFIRVEFFDKKLIEAIDHNILEIAYNEDIQDICLNILNKEMVDDGDYDYDDNYISNCSLESTYEQIFFSPYTGEHIEFILVKEIDESEIYTKLLESLKTKNKKNYKNHKRNMENIKEIDRLNKEISKYYNTNSFNKELINML